ncbi:helix-turn-helix domain-containing protein [Streptomyces lydicus]|uniref:helix-turn-helix domain-containing protein n=1 Tax=Streptomyces lydicus TaxID=47763 RepID=UPI00101238F3|nr:helix-turn-helix domain-containing protein [Streptomyces lydicus]MCZ1012080.1 helix-turn-helix domain-containing protein [Streptomyces lydicus]
MPVVPLFREASPADLNPYRPLAAMLTRGPGPHSLPDLVERTGLPRPELRRYLTAMTQTGLCAAVRGMPGHYELAARVTADDTSWLVHSLPAAPAEERNHVRELHEATGQVALMHGHVLLPVPLRIWVDVWGAEASGFLKQLTAHPDAAGRLRQAPLDIDAPGLVIRAHLDPFQPTSDELQSVRAKGYAVTAAPLPGWSLLSVPVHHAPEQVGLPDYGRHQIAGALSLVVPTQDLDAHFAQWLAALQHSARSLSHTAQTTEPWVPTVLQAA